MSGQRDDNGQVKEPGLGDPYWTVGRPVSIVFLLTVALLLIFVLTGVLNHWLIYLGWPLGILRFLVYRLFRR